MLSEEDDDGEGQLQLFPPHAQLFGGGSQLVLQLQLLPLHLQLFPVEATIAANPPRSFPSLLSSRGLKSLLSSNFNDFFRCFIVSIFKTLHIGFQKEISGISPGDDWSAWPGQPGEFRSFVPMDEDQEVVIEIIYAAFDEIRLMVSDNQNGMLHIRQFFFFGSRLNLYITRNMAYLWTTL